MKVYLHMYNGNVQYNPLCVESCVTKEFSISRRFSPTIFDPDANSVLLRAHLCTAVDSMRRKPWVRNCSREHKGLYNGNVQYNPLCVESCVTKEFSISRRFSPTIFDPDANSVLLRAHLCTAVDSMRRKPWVRNCSREHKGLYNGNVQYNPLCVESCVTKEFSISRRFSPTIFDPDANSVLLRAHLCTAVDSMRRKPWVRNCSREHKGLYNGNVQQNPLCAASCVTKDIPIYPRFSPTFFYRRANPAPYSAPFFIHSSPS